MTPDLSQMSDRGHGPAILRLPPAIRHRIYDHLEIRGPSPSWMEDDGDLAYVCDLNGKRHILPWPRERLDFHGLLLSCRGFYDEVSRLVYSTHHFTVRYSDRESLECIRNLRPVTVAALRHLRVILSEASCHLVSPRDGAYGLQCCTEEGILLAAQWCKDKHCHDEPLNACSNSRVAQLLSEWDSVVEHLAASILEDTLEVSLVCDVCPTDDGVNVARSVMSSFLRLPTIKVCSVRLCQQPDPRLQQLAQDAVLYSRGIRPRPPSLPAPEHPAPNSPSPLLNLPRELCLQILEYTDLITPFAQVLWSPDPKDRGRFISSTWHCETIEFRGDTCPPTRHHGCQFRRCWETFPSISRGCYCRVSHSAFSSAAPSVCKCWAPPKALFLVCRTLYENAQAVFFAGNRFVVHDRSWDISLTNGLPPEGSSDHRYPGTRFGASEFLRDIVPEASLAHLRFLEIVFPPYPPDMWPGEDHPALAEWDQTVEWARTRLNVNGMTMRLVMADQNGFCPRRDRDTMTVEQSEEVIAGYCGF